MTLNKESKISFPQDITCERIMHIIHRRTLEGQDTIMADIQEMIIGKRGNAGKHASLYNAVNFLKRIGFVKVTQSSKSKRKKLVELNWDNLKSRTIKNESIQFWKDLDGFYENNDSDPKFDPMFESIKFLERLKRQKFECNICFHISDFTFEEVIEAVGEGTLDYAVVKYYCENCGFRFSKELYT